MNTNLRQILIKMSKICIYGMIVQISAYSFAFAVSSRAQDKSVNAIQVQLDLKSPVQLEKVFKRIEKSTDFHFSYVDEQLNSSSYAVDINNSQILLGDLLMNISRQTDLSFRRVKDHIFIAKKEEGIEPIVEDIEMALKITGKITDEKGEPLPGATVLEKGTTNGTTTDLDGKFQLNSSENAILVISFVGYETREVSVNNRSVIDVQLGVDSEQLEEVVVVGYGTQRKSDVTGSLVSLSRDDFDKNPVMWNDFKTRFMELINERFNVDSMKVKKLLDPNINDVILTKSLLTLSFCVSNDGFQKLRASLLNI